MKQRPVLSAWPKANEPHTWLRVGYHGCSNRPVSPQWMSSAYGVTGHSRRVQQADRLRSSAAQDTGSSSGSRPVAGLCGRSRWAYGRLREGGSHERARCLKGIPIPEIPLASWGRMADSVRMAKLPACRFGFFLSFEAHDLAANLGRYG
jgi:hypothetical protein